jgi:hypothetical protein
VPCHPRFSGYATSLGQLREYGPLFNQEKGGDMVVDMAVSMVAVMDMVEGTVITNYLKILFLK